MNVIKHVLCFVFGLACPCCVSVPHSYSTDHPTTAAADQVQIVRGEPDPSLYDYVGDVQGEGTGPSTPQAAARARQDFIENAGAYHATLAVIDTNGSERAPAYAIEGTGPVRVATPIEGKKLVTVVLTGRAFRPKRSSQ